MPKGTSASLHGCYASRSLGTSYSAHVARPGAEEAALHGADRNIENLPDLFVIAGFHVAENNDGAHVRVEPSERFEKMLVIDARLGVEGGIEFRLLRQLIAKPVGLRVERAIIIGNMQAGGLAIFSGAAMAERQVDRDPKQPGVERRFAFECGNMLDGSHKGFLNEIGGVFGMADHAEDRGEKAILIAVDEVFHGGPVSALELAEREKVLA